MNKKQVKFHLAAIFLILTTLIILMSSPLVFAEEINKTQETIQVNKAYTWLGGEARDSWQPLGIEDNALALLALAWDDSQASQGLTALNDKSRDAEKECWASSCSVKETALAVLALSRIGRNTEKAEDWLMQQNGTPSELNWYLQVDTGEEATCSIDYDSKSYNISLTEDKKINKGAGSCLTLSYGNYWLKVSKSCYERKFTISCDKGFITTLFYQKPGSTTIYISSDTKRESAGGYAELKINSICLQESGICDYEGTAWAALALLKNRDISTFIPYLVGYAEKYSKFLPEAFLYMLTGEEDYAKKLVSMQKRQGYWKSTSAYGSYYDTALALLALEDYDAESKNKAKLWLLGEQATAGPDEGSWQSSKKDTAFLLYAIWPKEATYLPAEQLYCTDYGYFCLPSYDCTYDLRLPDYYCSGMQVCCKQKPEEKLRTCNEMGGLRCGEDEICTGTTTSASDGLCCMAACRVEEINECEDKGYICRYDCEKDEEEIDYECLGVKVCCASKAEVRKTSKAWIFWLLLILILGILLFLFRDKVKKFRPWQFRRGAAGGKPRFMPPGRAGPLQRRPIMPIGPATQAPPTATRPSPLQRFSLRRTETDKELEETLRKLREEGK